MKYILIATASALVAAPAYAQTIVPFDDAVQEIDGIVNVAEDGIDTFDDIIVKDEDAYLITQPWVESARVRNRETQEITELELISLEGFPDDKVVALAEVGYNFLTLLSEQRPPVGEVCEARFGRLTNSPRPFFRRIGERLEAFCVRRLTQRYERDGVNRITEEQTIIPGIPDVAYSLVNDDDCLDGFLDIQLDNEYPGQFTKVQSIFAVYAPYVNGPAQETYACGDTGLFLGFVDTGLQFRPQGSYQYLVEKFDEFTVGRPKITGIDLNPFAVQTNDTLLDDDGDGFLNPDSPINVAFPPEFGFIESQLLGDSFGAAEYSIIDAPPGFSISPDGRQQISTELFASDIPVGSVFEVTYLLEGIFVSKPFVITYRKGQ